jgi:hypothetical protein
LATTFLYLFLELLPFCLRANFFGSSVDFMEKINFQIIIRQQND